MSNKKKVRFMMILTEHMS